jgi:hypothetical protein
MRRIFYSLQTTNADAHRVAVSQHATDASIDTPATTDVTLTTENGDLLCTASTGSVTPQSFTGLQGARRIAVANPKRVSLEVVCESGTVRLGFDNTVSSTTGRKLLATAVQSFGSGPGVYQGDVWASDTGGAAVVQVIETWNA